MNHTLEGLSADHGDPASYTSISEWLASQALGTVGIEDLLRGVCERLQLAGVPLTRVSVMWPSLHPLFRAENLVWQLSDGVEHEHFDDPDGVVSSAWTRSPLKFLLDSDGVVLRRRLVGPEQLIDFDILEELAAVGVTDYLAMKTHFDVPRIGSGTTGILVSWATDRPTGFTDRETIALSRIQRRFAVAFRASLLASIMRTICTVYLGQTAGSRVLNGAIRRGDGETTTAVVWYADMRGSTALAERLSRDAYLDLLNRFFECAAGAVSKAGGETLSFIGDAVLAIFPYQTEVEKLDAAQRAIAATREALRRRDQINLEERDPISFGIGISHGAVMFGNIGVPDRLSFSVIGSTVNEVARLETITKALGSTVATSASFAALTPAEWESRGTYQLQGLAAPIEVFGWKS